MSVNSADSTFNSWQVTLAACAAAMLALPHQASFAQQNWPERPIHLIVVQPPGGGVDIVARALGQKLQQALGQPLVIDNRPGGSEIVGTQLVGRAAPDGLTFGVVTNTFAINPTLFPKLPYDTVRDFVPVTKLVNMPFVLLAPPGLGVTSVRELVALAKAKPGQLNFGHAGLSSPHFLAGEWFKRLAGLDVVAVGYKGAGDAMTAVSAGQVQFMFTGIGAGMAQVKAGRLVALAVTPARRLASAPALATVAEAGYPDYDLVTWHGLIAPKGTPPAIINRLNAETARALNSDELRERFSSLGAEAAAMSPDQFAEFIRADIEVWGRIVRLSGAKPE